MSPPSAPHELERERQRPWRWLVLAVALLMGSLFVVVIQAFTVGPSRGEDCLVVLVADCGAEEISVRVRNECPEDIGLSGAEYALLDPEGEPLPGSRTDLAWSGAPALPRASTEDRTLTVAGGGPLPAAVSGTPARVTLETALWDDRGAEWTDLSCGG